jgi:phytoene dehydrogenase-like protein
MSDRGTALVVGAGPNGLAAAARLATAGLSVTVLEQADTIGGGTRTSELTVPGLRHDHCSAFHPMAAGSVFLDSLGLDRYGLRWLWPEIDCAHPLDSGDAGVLMGSLPDTAAGLGSDGRTWQRLLAPTVAGYPELAEDLMRPLLRVPGHPLRLARFGPPALLPAAVIARLLRTEKARALFGGVAAHAYHPLNRPLTAGIGLTILAAGHRFGWPVAEGGSQAIADALAGVLVDKGGKIETGVRVTDHTDLPSADITLFDLTPRAVADILGDRLPARVARAYRRYRHGPAAFKLDLAVHDGIPWTSEPARRAGTVHLGGTFGEIAVTEREINAGRMPERPFVLVGQQYLADPSRSAGGLRPVWAYAHVPHGYTGDATQAIIAQIERFAPGFRERIAATAARTTADMQTHNPNYIGGDIIGGANIARQLIARPRLTLNPYSVGVPGMYICSATTPPGAGAHGMCGANAADAALRRLRR